MPEDRTMIRSQVRRFTRTEYERMAEHGILSADERVELVNGEIVVMSPQAARHAIVMHLIAEALKRAFGRGHFVRIQVPLALGPYSEPEPDVAVVAGSPDDYLNDHPKTAVLVVEVSDTTLAKDRGAKLGDYAAAGIEDYWVVNLKAVPPVIEVYRKPKRRE
ncbi:Uma2 family endonuclease, partial [bacterium]|nr:Uma2 family endonuclease [bacterium]